MKVLTNLESLEVPEPHRKHIDDVGTDAAPFLNDKDGLIHRLAEPGNDEVNIHLAVMRYILQVQSRGRKDRARWLLHMLLYFDLISRRCLSEGRIGPRTGEEIKELLKTA